MRNFNLLFISIILTLSIMSCSSTQETFWVRGVKTPCDMGAGKGECLNVYHGNALDVAEWQNFYNPIEGFEFQPGVAQKVKVTKTKLKASEVPADASQYKYSLDKVVQTEKDNSAAIEGSWVVTSIYGNPINRMAKLPTINLDVTEKRFTGFDGCNQLNSMINNITSVYIDFGTVAATKKMCTDMTVPDSFQKGLNSTVAYAIEGEQLVFYDDAKNIVLTFLPSKDLSGTPDDRINGEWNAVRINGNPINRMATPPHILVSTSKKMFIGNNGCNTFSAYIKGASSDKIHLTQPAIDQKKCKEMSVPNAFNKALVRVDRYEVEEGKLTLFDADGNEVLHFIPTPLKENEE